MIPPARKAIAPALSYPAFVALVLAFSALTARERTAGLALALNGLALVMAIVVSTVLHEGSHAAVARAVGLRVSSMFLGRGPALWERRIADTRLVLQAVPFTAVTMVVAPRPAMPWLRARLALMFAAGPAANALLLACVAPFARWENLAVSFSPALAFAAVNGFLVPAPPRKKAGSARETATDGWNVLALPFRTDKKLAPLFTAYAAWQSGRLLARGRVGEARALADEALKLEPSSIVARTTLTDVLLAQRAWSEAAPLLRALLEESKGAPEWGGVRPLLANNLAWADFMLDDASLLDEADRCSKEALDSLPRLALVHGTRGAVLAARGELAAAEPFLAFAFGRNKLASTRALNAHCLALVHAKRGAEGEARRWFDRARELNPRCSLAARVERALTPGTSGPPSGTS